MQQDAEPGNAFYEPVKAVNRNSIGCLDLKVKDAGFSVDLLT